MTPMTYARAATIAGPAIEGMRAAGAPGWVLDDLHRMGKWLPVLIAIVASITPLLVPAAGEAHDAGYAGDGPIGDDEIEDAARVALGL